MTVDMDDKGMRADRLEQEPVRVAYVMPPISTHRSGDDDRPAGRAVALGGEKAGPLSDRR